MPVDPHAPFDLSSLYEFCNQPAVPIISVLCYLLISNKITAYIRDILGLKPKGIVIQSITTLHSFALAVYSGWTCYHSWRIVYPYYQEHGFYDTFCDADGSLWRLAGWWITHFYISKYYEFIDTWIVVLKGRDPIFLQVYHHAGVVILMWATVVTQCTSAGIVLLCLNSAIHTVMYTYYTLAAFGYRSPLKNYLTIAQMVQFVTGIGSTLFMHFKEGCINQSQQLTLAAVQLYAVGLIILFGKFYIDTYTSKGKKKSSTKKKD
mmetsp:Transcript_6110/g.9215  ORF Transcript_6110/g.9215 Transcript_6110/m.9215 type:complete len:263 (+) Transcript_6110:52-840(+)|eukprot:CAMPEP_0185025668 /NCGR_PEP_ID=MMETSP1103-20130426/8703_1 /TAXON_ID=36769 /ORGANISM="Paraphysomonas bandaiensis, Strain Caron Lab Isolate" /LENGTH=262 /DNA_ID=CAMNT_0027558933 /DNA_START=47 /DNA_END=835 /DNA_ORIENTATION=-